MFSCCHWDEWVLIVDGEKADAHQQFRWGRSSARRCPQRAKPGRRLARRCFSGSPPTWTSENMFLFKESKRTSVARSRLASRTCSNAGDVMVPRTSARSFAKTGSDSGLRDEGVELDCEYEPFVENPGIPPSARQATMFLGFVGGQWIGS